MRPVFNFLTVSISLALMGCTTFADIDFEQRAQASLQSEDNNEQAQSVQQQLALTALLSNPQLEPLISSALTDNPNLKQSLSNFLEND